MRLTIDSNILVYAFLRGDAEKHRIAADLMVRSMLSDVVLAAQALAEFMNAVRRREPKLFNEARAQAGRWAMIFPVLDTSGPLVLQAAEFAARHRLQYWDSVIWQVARSAYATVFLSEDLQDGLSLEGMTVLNPFNSANSERLRDLLTDDPGSGS